MSNSARIIAASGSAYLGASGHLTADMSNPGTTWTTVAAMTEDFDTDGAFDPTTGIYTVPATGYYRFQCTVRFSGDSGSGLNYCGVSINGSSTPQYIAGARTDYVDGPSKTVFLSAGDTIRLKAKNDGSTSAFPKGDAATYLSVDRLAGPTGNVSIGSDWVAGSYPKGAIVKRDNMWWLANADTSVAPGSVIPPFRRDNYDIYSRARWITNGRVRLTDSTSQHGSIQAKTARPMQALDLYMGLAVPTADELYIVFADSADGSYVTDDYNFSFNNGVAVFFSSFNNVAKILRRTSHGAAATVVATAGRTWDKTIAQLRLLIVANGANWDVTLYDWTTSAVTSSAVTFPANVRPLVGAWTGGSGGNWDAEPYDDAQQSALWIPLGAKPTP